MLLSNYSIREERFGEIVREEIEWATLAEEFDYSCTDYVWGELDEDDNWIYLGTSGDTVYENFYNYIFESNIDEFSEIRDLIEGGSLDSALEVNNSFIPDNTYELNQQFVNNLYLETIAEHKEIASEDIQTLWQIASLTPYVGGDGVYSARVMLGLDPDDLNVPYRIKNPNPEPAEGSRIVNELKIYPNPTKDEITVELDSEGLIGKAKLLIYSSIGNKVFEQEIDTEQQIHTINLEMLQAGVYFYNFVGNKTYKGKITIMD